MRRRKEIQVRSLQVKNLSVWFGKQRCFRDVNLDFPGKQITAIVGPSGCGKSTFLGCLNRTGELYESWTKQGDVFFDGRSIFGNDIDLNLLRRRIGMISQRPNPFPFSIKKNLEIGLREHGFTRRSWGEIIRKNLQRVGLWTEVEGRLNQSALKLSGGQQQRLCIARAMALQPDVLILDEPCSALDPVATKTIEELLVDLKQSTTIVIVTHNLAQAKRIADFAAVFCYSGGCGRIVELGEAGKIFVDPSEKETKDFLDGRSG